MDLDKSFANLVDNEEVNNEIINDLNKLFGKNVKNLSKVSQHVEQLLNQKAELQKILECATNEAPDRITTALNKAKDVLSIGKHLQDEVGDIKKELILLLQRSDAILGNVTPQIKIIREAEKAKVYINWINLINEINTLMPELIDNLEDRRALHKYKEIRTSYELLLTSECINLKTFVNNCLQYWHQIILEKASENFESTLTSVKWPFLKEDANKIEITDELRENFNRSLEYLLYLDKFSGPDESDDENIPEVVKTLQVTCLPIKILLRPLKLRFFYHFSGKKATNSKENPQWYFTQILRWAALHENFIGKEIQPLLQNHCENNAKQEYMVGIVRLASIKLASDMPQIIADDELFSATVQEALNFDQELRSIGFTSADASIVRVLTQPDVFQKWLSLEEKFAHELLDEFVSSTDAFSADDDLGVCRCAEQLLLLLRGITNRCKQLPQPGHRIQFFELQLEIVDNFRVRILQLSKCEVSDPISSNYNIFLNTVDYVASTLHEWDDIPLFIELHYFRKRFTNLETIMRSSFIESDVKTDEPLSKYVMDVTAHENTFRRETIASFNLMESNLSDLKLDDVEGSAFGEMIQLYDHIESEMFHVLNNYVLTEFRARSQAYRREKWFGNNFSTISEMEPVDISPSFCPMIEVLVKHISSLKNKLTADIFSTVWHRIARSLDKYIYEEIILDTNFSSCGSLQLNYDVNRGFFPIFSDYSKKPENSFPLVKESLILLKLSTPTALLLRDTLNLARDNVELPSFSVSPVKALEERGVFNFTIKQAENVLRLRTDLFSL